MSFSFIFGQNIFKENENISSQLQKEISGGISSIETSNLTVSVNEKEYIVDAGDVFLIKIDVPGPATKVFPAIVTSDGHIMLPEAPSVEIKMLPLYDAKKKIYNILKDKNPDSKIEVFLYQVHPINVTILGSINETQDLTQSHIQKLLSSSRLFDAVQNAIPSIYSSQNFKSDLKEGKSETKVNDEEKVEQQTKIPNFTLRKIQILRNGLKQEYDLLRFKRLGDLTQNPYLLDNDIVIVPFKGEKTHSISVVGAVGQEFEFVYLPSDKLTDALNFAGGLLPTADSSRIELYRFLENGISVKKFILDFNSDFNFPLMPDDRIFARYKAQYHPESQVRIEGEVNFPGIYAIEEGKTTLTELVQRAGGLTAKAALRNAKIIRRKILLEDKELDRLKRMTVDEMNDLERSYFRLRTREDIRIVACDFEKLFTQNNLSEDVVLRDKDIIQIPEESKIVFVSGGVISPGNVVYNQSWVFKKYIAAAGGYNKRAKKGNVKIIKGKTGVWLDADEKVKIEEGDIIFVPEKKERDWWEMFKEGLLVTSQIATILFIVSNVSK